jgi:hypothetical protein
MWIRSLIISIAVAAFIQAPAAASECDLDGYEEGPPMTVYGRPAACLMSEAITLGQKCLPAMFHKTDPVEGDFYCDERHHRRFLQMLHPKYGFMHCYIVHQIDQRVGAENDPEQTFQRMACRARQFGN